jgi:alcohol dehydrogenase YqhD (iron-dependent ADH family)
VIVNFQFHTPTQIVVGGSQSVRAGHFAASMGKKVFAVASETSMKSGVAQRIFDSLIEQKIEYLEYKKPPGNLLLR